jgi:hypothetical protein
MPWIRRKTLRKQQEEVEALQGKLSQLWGVCVALALGRYDAEKAFNLEEALRAYEEVEGLLKGGPNKFGCVDSATLKALRSCYERIMDIQGLGLREQKDQQFKMHI